MPERNSLVGMQILHAEYGPGKIILQEGDTLEVEVGVLVKRKPTQIHDFIDQMYPSMRIKNVAVETVMEGDAWNLMPSSRDVHVAVRSIPTTNTGIILHTSNPPKPAEMKAEILQRLTNMGGGGTTNPPTALANLLATSVDLQLDWYLLRSREREFVYQKRVVGLQEHLGRDAWSLVIGSVLPDTALAASWTYAASLAALLSASDESDIDSAVSLISSLIERRLETHSGVVKGYTRFMKEGRDR